eukprot:9466148-Pyramimonas_sp.AAC.1
MICLLPCCDIPCPRAPSGRGRRCPAGGRCGSRRGGRSRGNCSPQTGSDRRRSAPCGRLAGAGGSRTPCGPGPPPPCLAPVMIMSHPQGPQSERCGDNVTPAGTAK